MQRMRESPVRGHWYQHQNQAQPRGLEAWSKSRSRTRSRSWSLSPKAEFAGPEIHLGGRSPKTLQRRDACQGQGSCHSHFRGGVQTGHTIPEWWHLWTVGPRCNPLEGWCLTEQQLALPSTLHPRNCCWLLTSLFLPTRPTPQFCPIFSLKSPQKRKREKRWQESWSKDSRFPKEERQTEGTVLRLLCPGAGSSSSLHSCFQLVAPRCHPFQIPASEGARTRRHKKKEWIWEPILRFIAEWAELKTLFWQSYWPWHLKTGTFITCKVQISVFKYRSKFYKKNGDHNKLK